MNRIQATQLSIFAGYHGDFATIARILMIGPLAAPRVRESFRAGQRFKATGVLCSCSQCNKLLSTKEKQ